MIMRIKFMDIYSSSMVKSIRLVEEKVPLIERVLKVNPQGTMLSWTKYEWKSSIPTKDRHNYLCGFNEGHLREGDISYYFNNPLIIETAGAYK